MAVQLTFYSDTNRQCAEDALLSSGVEFELILEGFEVGQEEFRVQEEAIRHIVENLGGAIVEED